MRVLSLLLICVSIAAAQAAPPKPDTLYLLKPAHIFDGESAELRNGWAVLVRGEKIEAIGPLSDIKVPTGTKAIELPGMTLMPGLIEAHSHVLLHPYTETVWNDQV